MARKVVEKRFTDATGKLAVVEEASTVGDGNLKGVVVIECRGANFPQIIELLKSPAAKDLAVRYAVAQGMSAPGLNSLAIRPYPVTENGTSDNIQSVADIKGYRANIALHGSIR